MNCELIFFDLGGVLVGFELVKFYQSLAWLFNTSMWDIRTFWKEEKQNEQPCFWHQCEEDPQWNEDRIRDKFCERFQKTVSPEAFRTAFTSGHVWHDHDAEHRISLLEDLRRGGVRLAILSNINVLHISYLENNFGRLLEYFPDDSRLYSVRTGRRKNQTPDAFVYACSTLKTRISRTVLVDDREENIQGFREVGGTGIQFRGLRTLRQELIRLGVLPT